MDNPQPAQEQNARSIFIRCRACGTQNCFEGIPIRRVDLDAFRGSENGMKCKGCHAYMDTMSAFVGERVGVGIERRPDPEY
jgi:hypothetical protein